MRKIGTNIKLEFQSNFVPSERALHILTTGKILGEHETPQMMIERVVKTLVAVERSFKGTDETIHTLSHNLGHLLDEKYCVMSTPILTNAGRYLEKPLSACSVPPINLTRASLASIRKTIFEFHQAGMGTGFNLNEVANPKELLTILNNFAIESSQTGKEDRPVGNMAILSVYHPKIMEFINAKIDADTQGISWKFNISVNCDAAFFDALSRNSDITLTNGDRIPAHTIFSAITHAAHTCADPGLIFLDRMEQDNPTPGVAHYSAPAPCAEVGLAPGESCQFAYINLGRYVDVSGVINMNKLRESVWILTRILDNALEISIENYTEALSKSVMSQKRKIGIGICGLADLLIKKGIFYTSVEARILARDLVAFINYESKCASHELAKERGSFGAMGLSLGNKHLESPSFIANKYGTLDTAFVTKKQWMKLSETILETKLLRHASTIALPPTGRSGQIVDASTGVEPVFSREEYELHNHEALWKSEYIQTATRINPYDHLMMVAAIQQAVDESISKTINMPEGTTPERIRAMYLSAWNSGLKGISIYREGSKKYQPRKLD